MGLLRLLRDGSSVAHFRRIVAQDFTVGTVPIAAESVSEKRTQLRMGKSAALFTGWFSVGTAFSLCSPSRLRILNRTEQARSNVPLRLPVAL